MLRVAVLTVDPALWSAVSIAVQLRHGLLIDLGCLHSDLPRRGAVQDFDLLVVDLRHPDNDWVWALRAPPRLPTLVIVQPKTPTSLKKRLSKTTRHDLTFMAPGASPLLSKIRSFVGLHSALPKWQARFGNYVLRIPDRTIEIAGQGVLRLSEHKFRFTLSLFLHCRARLHWSRLHQLAWGEEIQARETTVAAHASWAKSLLELDGRHGYELVFDEAHYELRRRRTSRIAKVSEALEVTNADHHFKRK